MPVRPYIFYELTNSVCSACYRKVEAKIVFQDDAVWMRKRCPEHGQEKVLISTDIAYYKKCRDFNKPGDMPHKFNTPIKYGCPYDCGLCPDHEQHSCVTLLELTDRCNLTCPTCYTVSSPSAGKHRTLAQIRFMLDAIIENEKEPDVVQISGGEPTLHPDFWAVMDMCKAAPIRHLMINTNGHRIAADPDFARRLADYTPGLEVYLQFDSLKAAPLLKLRGVDLRDTRAKALNHLEAAGISTTLVCTLQQGLNTGEMGAIVDYALTRPHVRGVTFQPTQVAGRTDGFDPRCDRITIGEARQNLLDQSPIFTPDDLVPVPCHPDSITMGYALRMGSQIMPLTRYFTPEDLLSTSRNTITFEHLPELRAMAKRLFSTGTPIDKAGEELREIMCCLPKIDIPELGYENLFRVLIIKFMDAYDFDVRSVKKSCVHIVHQDGRLIPIDTMNLFYRDPAVEARLKERAEGMLA